MVAAPAVELYSVVLALHIMAVVVAFGVTFAYPLIVPWTLRHHPRSVPFVYTMMGRIGSRLISPVLLVILLAGIYLASKTHAWKYFYVQWSLAVVVIIGALGGMYFSPRERKAAELAERDVAATPDGQEVVWSEEFRRLVTRHSQVSAGMSLLVLVTVYIMTVQATL